MHSLRVAKFYPKVGSRRTTKIKSPVFLITILVVLILLPYHLYVVLVLILLVLLEGKLLGQFFYKKSGSQEDKQALILGCPHLFFWSQRMRGSLNFATLAHL